MQRGQVRHALDCSASAYWRCILDDEYHRRLYLDVLKYRSFEPLSIDRADAIVTRRVYVDPSMAGVPDAIAKAVKVFGDSSWVEESSFDAEEQKLALKYETSAMRDKTTIVAEVRCVDRPDGRCERLQDTSVEVRLFAVGSLLEKAILADIHKTFDGAAADFTASFAREKGWV